VGPRHTARLRKRARSHRQRVNCPTST
jgi:hypothetical protein